LYAAEDLNSDEKCCVVLATVESLGFLPPKVNIKSQIFQGRSNIERVNIRTGPERYWGFVGCRFAVPGADTKGFLKCPEFAFNPGRKSSKTTPPLPVPE